MMQRSGALKADAGPPLTIEEGQVAVSATANNFAGSYTITASAGGTNQPATFALTNTAVDSPSIEVSVNTLDLGTTTAGM